MSRASISGRAGNSTHPLHDSARFGQVAVTKLLLDRGESVHRRDEAACTPLHIAAKYCKLEVLKVLIDAGANVNAADDSGRTALHMSASKGHEEAVIELVEAGADVHKIDNVSRWTPLHDAVSRGKAAVVRYLIENANADVNAVDMYRMVVCISRDVYRNQRGSHPLTRSRALTRMCAV